MDIISVQLNLAMSGNFQFEYLEKIGIDELDIIVSLYKELMKELQRERDGTR